MFFEKEGSAYKNQLCTSSRASKPEVKNCMKKGAEGLCTEILQLEPAPILIVMLVVAEAAEPVAVVVLPISIVEGPMSILYVKEVAVRRKIKQEKETK